MIRRLKLALSTLALVALPSLFLVAPAQASNYVGNCAGVPTYFNGEGNVDITDSACSLGNLSATGYIHMAVGSLSAGDLTSGEDININSSGAVTADAIFASDTITITAASGDIGTDEMETGYAIEITASSGDIDVNGGIVSTYDEINITASGDVTVDGDETSGLNTLLSGTNVTAMTISSQWGVQATATSGDLDLQDITSNANDTSTGGNILLMATGNIGTGDITNNGMTTTGGIEIRANTGGGGGVFTVGGGGPNGSGVLTTTNTTGGGTDPTYLMGGAYITDGGGITINDATDIAINSSGARSGILILDAGDGTITLPTGSLNSDGSAGNMAGQINLLANTVTTVDGTILSASQDTGATASQHGVAIAAGTINVAGATGYQVLANGNGTGDTPGIVAIMPEGGATASSTEDVNDLIWSVAYNDYFALDGSVTVAGDGAFTAEANGTDEEVAVTGYPVSFTNGAVTLESQGPLNNSVYIGYDGTFTGTTGVAFTGSGAVVIDASGNGGPGGIVQIYADQATISSPSFTMSANGDIAGTANGGLVVFEPTEADISSTFLLEANGGNTGGDGGSTTFYMTEASIAGTSFTVEANGSAGGDGDGGTVLVETYPDTLTLDDGTTALIEANASTDGTGNAQGAAVTFYPGDADFNVGSGEGQFAFAARGGSAGGNGGGLFVEGYSSAVTVYGAGAMTSPLDVSAPGDTGDGGAINLTAYNGLTFDGDDSVLTADSGTTSGNGGQINIQTSVNPVVIGTGGDGDVTLTATGQGTNGNGGTVSVISYYGITADTTCISVTAAGDGTGGTITLNADYSELTLDGDLDASGGTGNGQGGSISLTGGYITLADDVNTSLVADGNGTGDGGSISITTNYSDVTVSGDDDALSLEAMSNGSADGGSVTINSAVNLTADGTYVNVAAGPDDGDGGQIYFTAAQQVTISGTIDASGTNSGQGGIIDILQTGADYGITLSSGAVLTALGDGAGSGNYIELNTAGALSLTDSILSDDGGTSGDGGDIYITANSMSLSGSSTTFDARGGAGSDANSGAGGLVQVTLGNPVVLTNSNLTVAATGAGSSAGGSVEISNATSPGVEAGITYIDVNTFITVDAGSMDTDTYEQGSITMNDVVCQQYLVSHVDGGSSIWPTKYWDCTGGNSVVVPTVQNTAQILTVATYVLQPLATAHAQLYTIDSLTDWDQFFGVNPGDVGSGAAGITFQDNPMSGLYVVSSIFATVSGTDDPNRYPVAVTAHELGHALDIIWGAPSVGENFSADAASDLAPGSGLNLASCDAVFGSTICTDPAYSGYSNAQIYCAEYLQLSGGSTTLGNHQLGELWAQMYEHLETGAGDPIQENALSYFTYTTSYMTTAIDTGSHP